jgi:hypothetical protein
MTARLGMRSYRETCGEMLGEISLIVSLLIK